MNIKMNKVYLALGWAVCFGIASVYPAWSLNDGSRYTAHSVLSTGKWIQIQVKENAVYKLTYEDIKKMGIGNPAKVKIYGYGGWILPEDFTKPYIDDLPEVAVWMNKGADGLFGAGDFLLFYGRGPVKWTYNSRTGLYEHENNPYSAFGSYFLTESDEGPKLMEELNLSSAPASATNLTSFDDYVVHEKDEISIIDTGRMLFGERFIGQNTQDFTFSIPGITSDPGAVRVSFIGAPPPNKTAPLSVSVDGVEIFSRSVSAPVGEYERASLADTSGKWTGEKKEQTTVRVSYNSEGQSVAYLDFITLNMKRRLQFYNTGFTFFRNKESLSSDVIYTVENATAQSLVWDITGNYDAKLVKTSGDGNKLSFGTTNDNRMHEYVLVDYNRSFPVPVLMGEVKNQDLHGTPPLDYVMIVPGVFRAQADRLAERHRQNGLNVLVVQPEWVYNEFSSGNPDATAYRRFMKMFYDRAAENEKPKYLLLFGDGLFDNRHLTSTAAKLDARYYLLTFQMVSSLAETTSYGTDDYFGFLDDNEGTNLPRAGLDIGVGRFPVNTVAQAENVVRKIIAYMNNTYKTEWKNKIISTADNIDPPVSPTAGNSWDHVDKANKVAGYIEYNNPQYMITKSYMDAFKPVNLNGQTRFPDAKEKFLKALNEGCFMVNYTGHGSKTSWSGEDMLNIVDVRKMNFEGLPLWITATCDFGWFDGFVTSAGEEAFLNKNGAAIALYTTSRVVYSQNNYEINRCLVEYIFSKPDGKRLALGDIARLSKRALGYESNKLNYVLLGDPGLTLNYPDLRIEPEKINGEPVDKNKTYVFRALDDIVLEGTIVDENGNIVSDFNGDIKTTVFDSKQIIKSISTTTAGNYFTFPDYPNRIFLGKNRVTAGRFSVSFTVPLDISYSKEKGKMNFYAFDEKSGLDANGYHLNYMLDGSNDKEPGEGFPEIKQIFLNSEAFVNGDNVNETPFFVARVRDEAGINMTGNGLGHNITVCLDNSSIHTYSLNSYYVPEDNKSGEVRFSIPEMTPGNHRLVFKIWNIINHSSSDSLFFNVVKGLKPTIFDITATNVPARDFTTFRLLHDRPESVIDVEIFVYDLTGRAVWSHKETGSSSWMKGYGVDWDLTNSSGKRVEEGIYLYRATVNAPEGRETTKAKKIIVLRQ